MIRAATEGEINELGKVMGYDPSRCAKGVVFLEEKSIRVGIVFDHWTVNAVQAHIFAASLKALFNAEFLREIFTYAFVTAGRGLLIAVTPSDQRGSLAVSSWLGFRETYRIKDGWSVGVDMVVKELRREECKFLSRSNAA